MLRPPHCHYPTAAEPDNHGLQRLPDELPLINFTAAAAYRSASHTAIPIETFSHEQVMELIRMIAKSFVLNEPMNRHMNPCVTPPEIISQSEYLDRYGEVTFGHWNKENIFTWLIRLLVFDQLGDRLDRNDNDNFAKQLSLAILDQDRKVIGGALNIHLPSGSSGNTPDAQNPFSKVVVGVMHPIVEMLVNQEESGIAHLCNQYPDFHSAMQDGKVGELFMLARSPLLPPEDAFELVAASAERFIELGYHYILTAAANQWTGAAFEILGGVRVHFAPYRAKKTVTESPAPLPNDTSTRDGFLSAKDSGCMLYVLKLK